MGYPVWTFELGNYGAIWNDFERTLGGPNGPKIDFWKISGELFFECDFGSLLEGSKLWKLSSHLNGITIFAKSPRFEKSIDKSLMLVAFSEATTIKNWWEQSCSKTYFVLNIDFFFTFFDFSRVLGGFAFPGPFWKSQKVRKNGATIWF